MKCPYCGNENPNDTKFCAHCGAQINIAQHQPILQQPPNQQYYSQQYQQPPYQQQPVVKEKKKMGCFTIGLIVLGVLILLGIIGMAFGNSGDSENTTTKKGETTSVSESESKTDKEETSHKQEKGVYTLDDVELKFKSSKVVKEEYGNYYYLIVNFEYTNNSSDTKAFDDCVTIKAFQSGVELQSPISTYGIPDYDFHYSEKEVKPGVTLTVQEAFRLDDRKNAVSIEIHNGVYFIDNPDYEFEVKIDK